MVSAPTDITTLLKRLEVLQNLIALQDTDDIDYQISKIEILNDANRESSISIIIDQIISEAKNKMLGNAMRLISALLQQHNALARWVNPEVQGLLAEIKAKSALINNLEEELTDLEKMIHDFELRHTQELGYLILNMLTMKSKLAEQAARQNPDSADYQQQFNNAKTEEEEYKGSYKRTLENPAENLEENQMQELKTKFKKISKLTHPDLVDKRFEEEATNLFIRAKIAKDKNNLAVINEIWEYLEYGKPFTLKEETMTDAEELKAETKRLYFLAEQLFQKIRTIKISEAYLAIIKITNWDEYFSDIKEKLTFELNYLKSRCNE